MNVEKKRKTLAWDLLLIAFFVILALIAFLVVSRTEMPASYAIVRINGEVAGKFSLQENGTYVLNSGTNILEIKDGYAYLTDAQCPDKLCVKQGRVHSTGQCITCLPNKLTVTMEGGESQVDFEI